MPEVRRRRAEAWTLMANLTRFEELFSVLQGPPESENTAGAAWVRFLRNLDLRNSSSVVAADAEDVLSTLERPIVSP